ncbi:type II toxin-antitoxin system prevent-host-death family antitoxin [Luteipulveratus sp. YIM 133132]|uniref:type II toxin-antitoxin system Phd/YefM family antitoxin n=1 Tax=Luteipulveratus flavus TaxID=3031728 RepID=UPI0023B037EC|nr:type II toxin-antitoxin system prevent-host-death family antitoxin [Luteipulveratus sp. YIM 133132]MDE9364778.1 type II toxin-antitoxin system prevent-host-death family antitoxin [Luteipulveratus sp. YIM 133132]
MPTVNIYVAKATFSRLIAAAEAGETVVIARNGRPVAQLGPIAPVDRPVTFGDLKGQVAIGDDFGEWTDQDERDWFGA